MVSAIDFRRFIEKELDIIDLYIDYMKRIRDPDIRKSLMTLIIESLTHADTFDELLRGRVGAKLYRDLSEEEIEVLLERGMEEEVGARHLYESALGDPNIKPIEREALETIIEDEKRHEQILREIVEKLKSRHGGQ